MMKMRKWHCMAFFLLLVCCHTAYAKGAAEPDKKTILLPNGESYAYLEQGEGAPQTEQEAILLLHGNTASSLHFLPLFGRIKNARLVAPDMRGFGDSSCNEGFSSLDELAEDVKLFADALGISRAHIVGWSTGGGVALILAAKYPELVQSLFIIQGVSYRGIPVFKSSSGGVNVPYESKEELAATRGMATMLAALRNKDENIMNLIWKAGIYTHKKPPAKDNRVYIAESLKQQNLIDVYWALMHFNMSGEHNGYSEGAGTIFAIRCPVTFTCALLDKVIAPAIVRENAAAIAGSKVLEYAKSGHSPMVDLPDRLANDILFHLQNYMRGI